MKIIKYQLETEINYGTPEEPDIETLLSPVTVTYTEEAYAIAQDEAYQGQITVEDDGVPVPPPHSSGTTAGRCGFLGSYAGGGVVTVYDMARAYYPRLWDDGRLNQLIAAGRLSAEEAAQIRADSQAPASAAK